MGEAVMEIHLEKGSPMEEMEVKYGERVASWIS